MIFLLSCVFVRTRIVSLFRFRFHSPKQFFLFLALPREKKTWRTYIVPLPLKEQIFQSLLVNATEIVTDARASTARTHDLLLFRMEFMFITTNKGDFAIFWRRRVENRAGWTSFNPQRHSHRSYYSNHNNQQNDILSHY